MIVLNDEQEKELRRHIEMGLGFSGNKNACFALLDAARTESEPVATVWVGKHDHGPFVFRETAHGADVLSDGDHNLYLHPSPVAPQRREAMADIIAEFKKREAHAVFMVGQKNSTSAGAVWKGRADAFSDAIAIIEGTARYVGASALPASGKGNAELIACIESLLTHTRDSVVRCGGDKCREPNCESCCGEDDAHNYIQTAWDAAHAAKKLITPPATNTEGQEP